MNFANIIKSKFGNMTPQQICTSMLKNNTNPMIKNMLELANNGNTNQLESIARNMFKERGIDFDKEFSNFINNINL